MITFKFRRALAARWAELNTILRSGEPGFEIDSGKLKIGDGVKTWSQLNYLSGEGSPGPQGPAGPTGPAGAQGSTGATGPQGPKGDTGATGSAGPQGVKGDTGDAGPAGPKGDKGDVGDAGPQGTPGVAGSPGADGAVGPAGPPGPSYGFSPEAYGFVGWSGEPLLFGTVSAISTGTSFYARVPVPRGKSIAALWTSVASGGSYSANSVPNQLAVYDDDGNRIGITDDDSGMWVGAAGTTYFVKNLPSPIPAESEDRFVYVAFICGGFTGVSPAFPMAVNGLSDKPGIHSKSPLQSKRRAAYINGASSLLSSFDPTTIGTATSYIPLVGVA